LCTSPKRSVEGSENCPIGLVVVSSLASESAVIILLSDFSIYCLPSNYDTISAIASNEKSDGTDAKRVANRDYFIDTVKRILQRNASVPILRARGDKQISEQEAAELMCRCVEILRKEYVERLLAAREACEKRVVELGEIFAQQDQDLLRLEQSSKAINDRALNSAQRVDELEEKQKNLWERLKRIPESVLGGETGKLSADEETRMLKPLIELKDEMGSMVEDLDHLKERVGEISVDVPNEPSSLDTPTRLNVQLVKKRLEEQQHQIESLMRTVKGAQDESQ